MDAEKFLRLLHIDEELIEIAQWLNENDNCALASKLTPLIDELTRLIAETKVEKSEWRIPE